MPTAPARSFFLLSSHPTHEPTVSRSRGHLLLHPLASEGRGCMDRRSERKAAAKRGREEEVEGDGDFPFEEAAGDSDGGVGEASRRPPGVFQLPWQKCRGGLGLDVPAGGGAQGWELRDVFFLSLVDGGAAAIGVPGDRLVSPPSTQRVLLEGVDAWLADGAEDVDPVWRSALKGGPGPAPSAAS